MKWGGRRNMRLNHAIIWVLAAPMLSIAADKVKDELSVRKRVPVQEGSASEVVVTEKGYQTDGRLVNNVGDELLENLWTLASVGAQLERGPKRGLQSRQYPFFSMPTSPVRPSQPSQPSQPSRPNPTPSPEARTPAPVDGPTMPSSPSTPVAPLPTAPISKPTTVPGVEPSCLIGKTRDEFFFDLLVPITSGRLLNDPSTPQGQAYDFLVNQDIFLEDPCQSTTIDQRFGLVTLFYSTGGDDWSNSSGWLGEEQECLWSGVTCSSTSERARMLQLSNNNMTGPLPNEISTLFSLERFEIYANSVTGTIPSGISNLTNLILLDLEENQLSGEALPEGLLNLKALIAYRASENQFTGEIPTSIGTLTNLEQLWLAENAIAGEIPTEVARPVNLESLFLYSNELVGALPSELGSLSNLEDLRVFGNFLQDVIPPGLFSATNLKSLRLEFNFFSGQIPSLLGNLVLLEDFRIDTNSLDGILPVEIGLLTSLETFMVNNNFISGSIPDVFSNFNRLDFIDVSNARLTGPIPETLFDIATLRLVYMSNNTLTGTIPATFSKPPLLRDLYLNGNKLSGTIPSIEPGQLSDFNEFLFHFNNISGIIPAALCDLRTNDGNLDDLFADCGGQSPEIVCEFPTCCNRCFEGVASGRRRR